MMKLAGMMDIGLDEDDDDEEDGNENKNEINNAWLKSRISFNQR